MCYLHVLLERKFDSNVKNVFEGSCEVLSRAYLLRSLSSDRCLVYAVSCLQALITGQLEASEL
jgi:hypothetical protein